MTQMKGITSKRWESIGLAQRYCPLWYFLAPLDEALIQVALDFLDALTSAMACKFPPSRVRHPTGGVLCCRGEP